MKSKVAVLKTAPATVLEDYGRLMRMADYTSFLPKDKSVHLKLNTSWHVWYPACSTAPWQLDGVIGALLDDGYERESLLLTQNRTPDADDRVAEVSNGHTTVAERYGLDFTRLYEPPVKWVLYEPKAEMLVLDRMFGSEGIWIPDILIGTNIIHLPTVKTNVLTGTDGAIKNAFGGLLHDCRDLTRDAIHETLVDLLAIQKEIHAGIFAVMDGTICGDGPGPREMVPYEKDYILAGADQVAIDAVAAKMMGFDPLGIRYIRLAHERGLGCGDVREIEIVGEDISGIDFHFQGSGGRYGGPGTKAGRHGPLRPLENALMRGPFVTWTYAASNAYDDYYWFPFHGRALVDDMAETKWGQLLCREYLPAGAELEKQGKSPAALVAGAAALGLLGLSAFARVARMARHPVE